MVVKVSLGNNGFENGGTSLFKWQFVVSSLLVAGMFSRQSCGLAAEYKFPSFSPENGPTKNYVGKNFKLSQNYPTTIPSIAMPWKKIDFKKDPNAYALAIRDYAYAQNLKNGDWVTDESKWFHAPYMHLGLEGREFVHGLTKERNSEPFVLHEKQKSTLQNWAVAAYNGPGGYTFGKVWSSGKPDLNGKNAVFPEGTICIKLLFTDAPIDQVPFMERSVEWTAHVNERGKVSNDEPIGELLESRKLTKVRLLQIDMAVRDNRANDTTGWILGTFMYDPKSPGPDGWHRMVPVGIAWGDDPGLVPGGGKPRQSTFNKGLPIAGEFGWAGRLNGAVDNRRSSCISCHSTASYPPCPSLPPKSGDNQQRLIWFRNIKAGEPFAPNSVSLDYSLQMAKGVNSYFSVNPKDRPPGLKLRANEKLPITREDLDTPVYQQRIKNFLDTNFPASNKN